MAMSPEELEAMLAMPAMEAPFDIEPNFDSPPNENGLAFFVTTFCIVVSVICVILRIYARVWLTRSIRIEEIFMLLALGSLGGTAYAGYEMIAAPGYYVHQWNLTLGDLVQPFYLILIYGCCYSAVLPLIKTAILLDWCRVFVTTDRFRSPFWWCCVGLGALQCIWGVMCIVLLNMQCRPHNAIWEFYLPSKCYDLPSVMLGSASVQVITDVCMVLLPQRLIWTLHTNWQRKVGIATIFGVGLIACIAACFRLSHTITFKKEEDRMFFIGPLLFWAWAEMTAGFFIFSVPCLPKMIKESSLPRHLKSILGFGSSWGKSNPTGGSRSNPGLVTIGGSGGPKITKMTRDGHIELPENGMHLTDVERFERSESQEELYHGKRYTADTDGKNGVTVMRTTQVTVSSDADGRSGSSDDGNGMPWTKVGRDRDR